jgi:hypothetical protein
MPLSPLSLVFVQNSQVMHKRWSRRNQLLRLCRCQVQNDDDWICASIDGWSDPGRSTSLPRPVVGRGTIFSFADRLCVMSASTQKRTWPAGSWMSALCHKRTFQVANGYSCCNDLAMARKMRTSARDNSCDQFIHSADDPHSQRFRASAHAYLVHRKGTHFDSGSGGDDIG